MARARKKAETTVAPPDRAWLIAVAAAALVAFIALAVGNIATNAPTSDEPPHLAAGYTYLVTKDYRVNPEHPPLLKAFAALPMLAMHVWPARFDSVDEAVANSRMLHDAWALCLSNPANAEWSVAQYMLYGLKNEAVQRSGGDALNPPTDVRYSRSDFLNDPDRFFFAGRLMMLLVAVALAATIFWWSYSLWGLPGAVFSLLLFCFDPNFIAHGGLITTDVGAAWLICAASYFFWRCCRDFRPWNVIVFALVFALAQIAKFSAVLLIPMLIVVGLIEIVRSRRIVPAAVSLAAAAVATIFVIWAAYDFRFSAAADPAAALRDEQSVRATTRLALIPPDVWPTGHFPLNDAVDLWYALGRLRVDMPSGATEADLRAAKRTTPVGFVGKTVLFMNDHHLLPESFLYGFAWAGASSVSRTAYLNGQYSFYGFPSYFFWTTLYKTPIPLLLLMIGGTILALRTHGKRGDLLFVAIPALIYAAFAFTSTINIGHRHIFPVFPFLYVMAGALGGRLRAITGSICIALLAITANFALFPKPASLINRHISYLNEIAGGPVAGWDKLSDSNIDWGQDIPRVAAWLREHKIDEPVDWVVFGNADPRYYGIRYTNYRFTYTLPTKPGYVAISQMGYLGILFDREHRNLWRDFLARTHARRIGTAGYSVFLYKIDQLP